MAVLGYLPKKKRPETSFWCTFSAWFLYKNVLYLILYQWTKFQCHNLFSSRDIKQNVLFVTVDNIINFKIYLGPSSRALSDRKKKKGIVCIGVRILPQNHRPRFQDFPWERGCGSSKFDGRTWVNTWGERGRA